MKKFLSFFLSVAFVLSSSFGLAPSAFANPSYSHTLFGNIRIEESNGVYTIYASDRAIGVFHSFGNDFNEIINSIQSSSDFTALFRVSGMDPSVFNGIFNANSRIFLINPNGIVFGHGSQINAASLVASTLDMADNDFLSQNYRFAQNSLYAPAAVINQGTINAAPGGYVALLGGAVSNEGVINADGGSVALAAGNRASIALDGAGFISVQVDEAVLQNVYDLNGNRIYDAVSNSGEIRANGGYVVLDAKAAEGVFDNVINHSGIIEATTVGEQNGHVVFNGGDSGIVRISGDVNVRGDEEGETGGNVEVLGEKVGLFGNATIDASGDAGGGTVLFGGDYQGQGSTPTSDYAFIGSGASIRADALRSGNGGRVIVWSEIATRVGGTITAKGGQVSGDGGFIETSSHQTLEIDGAHINANASHGNVGTWLMDPWNVEITGANANGGFDSGSPNVFTPTATASTVNAATIEASLEAGTSVTITTGTTGGEAGNITVTNAILKDSGTSSATLTLTAANNIIVNNTITSTSGALGVTFTAGGAVDINSDITTNGGAFSSTGTTFDNTGSDIATGTGNFTVNHTGAVTLADTITVGGNIDIDTTSTVAVTAGAIVTGGGTGRTFTIDAAGITVGTTASGALRQTGTGTMALTATGATNIVLDDNAINIADGALTLTAGGNVNATDPGNDTAEIDADGNVSIAADGIGNTNQLEITGDAGGDRTLTLSSTAAANEAIDLDILTDQFNAISLTLADADSNVDIGLPGADVIDINGGAGTSTLNNIVLTNTDAAFTYSLSESGSSIAVTNIDMGAAAALSLSTNSAGAGGISLGNAAIDIGSGALTLSAIGGNINGTDGGAADIDADGNVTLTAAGIGVGGGDTGQVEITGDASGNSTLTIDSRATAGQEVNVDVATDQFSAIALNLDDADTNVAIEHGASDVITITGGATDSTLTSIDLDATAPSFTFSLDQAATNIIINTVVLGAGAFSATAQGGNITVDAAGNGIVASGSSAITLVADGGGTLTINDVITSVGGAIILRADDDVIFGAGGDITSTNGNITVKADYDDQDNGTGGAITMNDGTLISAGTGTITMTADENITLGGLLTTNATASAVTITSTSGGVVDGGDTFTDISAASGGAVITTVNGVGSAGAIETTLSSLTATASGTGNIQIVETNAITLTSVTTTDGSISVSAGGAVVATNVNAAGTGADVTLSTSSGGMTLTNVIADDDITVTAPGDLTLGVIGDSGTDDISLTTTAGGMTDANGATNNITGDALTLTSFGDIGSSGDPIEINVTSFVYNLTGAGSTAYLAASGASTVLDLSLSSGNIFFSSVGDLTVKRAVAAAGNVELIAAGSIYAFDDSSIISAYGDIRLIAGGTLGTIDRPLVVQSVNGHLYLSAGASVNNLSAYINGNLLRGNVSMLNVPPGLILYSGQLIAGKQTNLLLPSTNELHNVMTRYSTFDYPAFHEPVVLDGFLQQTDYSLYSTL